MPRRHPDKLKALISSIPAQCYENPDWKGLSYFARDLGLYAVSVAVLLSTDHPLLLVPFWVLAALAVSGLFVIGHDAAHGALFRSKRLSYLVGQAAFLPSWHAYGVWAFGHNRIHHGHTGCAGIDFVWHPLTPDEYERLSPLARLRHRFEWTFCGAGLYYLRIVWWKKMVFGPSPARLRGVFRRDRLVVAAFILLGGCASGAVGHVHYGSPAGALWTWTKVAVVPWILFTSIIGAVVYLHHIGPNTPWYRRSEWTKLKGPLECTRSYRAPAWVDFFWHNIFFHVAHHVDPRIPFYNLPAAATAIAERCPEWEPLPELGLRDYVRTTRRCKLYDFERGTWTSYGGERVAAERSRNGSQTAVGTNGEAAAVSPRRVFRCSNSVASEAVQAGDRGDGRHTQL